MLVDAVSLCRTLGFRRLLGVGLLNLGLWAITQDEFELACSYFQKGYRLPALFGTQRQIIHGLSMLGYTRMRQGDFNEALMHLQEGLQTARTKGMPRYVCNLQRNLAYTYLALAMLTRPAVRCMSRLRLHKS